MFNYKDSKVVIYPAPTGASLSDDYILKVNGHAVDIYRGVTWQPDFVSSFGGPYSFAYFDFSGNVSIEVVSLKKNLDNVRILPVSKGIKPFVNGNNLTFTLETVPSYISIEPDVKNGPLLLFANPLEKDSPKVGEPGVKYYGPGIHKDDVIELHDNETLYVSGGAIIRGGVYAKGFNIKILGRGIIDGLEWPRFDGPTDNILKLNECDDVVVDGIILKDGWSWNFNICGCRNVNISNFKLLGSRCRNNDGIDISNTKHLIIEDSFIRSDDDCIAVKGFGYRSNQADDDIQVYRTSMWSDKAHIWRIGCECRTEAMRNFIFKDIDVLHYSENWVIPGELPIHIEEKAIWDVVPDYMMDRPTCISFQPAEEMLIENVRFEDIRINHEGKKWFLEIFPKVTRWAEKKVPGRVINCYFKNIELIGDSDGFLGGIRICGPDAKHNVQDITFENVVRHGKQLLSDSQEIQMLGYVSGIKFLQTSMVPEG